MSPRTFAAFLLKEHSCYIPHPILVHTCDPCLSLRKCAQEQHFEQSELVSHVSYWCDKMQELDDAHGENEPEIQGHNAPKKHVLE